MPEIPELETIAAVLNRRIKGQAITSATVRIPVVVRQPAVPEFTATLTGNRFLGARRVGKYVLATLESGHVLAINLMLTGRLQLAEPGARLLARTSWIIAFENGKELRLAGERLDARVYLVPIDKLAVVPQFSDMGPDALDPALTFDVYRERLRKFTGQIKGVLVNHKFIAGTGNAYADEILYGARMNPFTTVKMAGHAGVGEVYQAMAPTLRRAIDLRAGGEYLYGLGKTMGLAKKHDVMRVHNKAGEPCPTCGRPVTLVEKSGRGTFYCEQCQPERP